MRRLRRATRDPYALDQNTAERLLAGRLDPADAPPGYARVADLLATAASPQHGAEEQAGKAAAMAAYKAVVRTRAPSPPIPQRSRMFTKLFTIKVVAAAVLSILAVGAAAAETGNLPAPAQRVVDSHRGSGAATHGPASTAAGQANAHGANANGSAGHDPASTAAGRANAQGPDLTGAAAKGLCQAWSAGQGGDNGKKMDAVAFAALAKAAGGASKIASFCANVMSTTTSTSHDQSQGTGQSNSSHGKGSPPTTAGH